MIKFHKQNTRVENLVAELCATTKYDRILLFPVVFSKNVFVLCKYDVLILVVFGVLYSICSWT